MAARTGEGRAVLVEAGYELIAELGYSGATTAKICQRAGVSSGTFFHFFPTKMDLLLGILEADASHSRLRADALNARASIDPAGALSTWLDTLFAEASDPHLAGFVAGLSAAPAHAPLEECLSEIAALQHTTLVSIVAAGQVRGIWRDDLAADRLALWIGVLADGILTRSVEDAHFAATVAAPDAADLVARYLAPGPVSF